VAVRAVRGGDGVAASSPGGGLVQAVARSRLGSWFAEGGDDGEELW
jgi:hypothetical protein